MFPLVPTVQKSLWWVIVIGLILLALGVLGRTLVTPVRPGLPSPPPNPELVDPNGEPLDRE
jgi:hypothetical protein